MQNLTEATELYRAQIANCAQAMSIARNDAVNRFLSGSGNPAALKMFTDGNLEKRFLKLQTYLDELNAAFTDLEDLLVAYVKEVPLAAYATESSDGQRFLDWLGSRRSLSAEGRDYVTLIRSRHAVERIAEANRFRHVRFQELWPAAAHFAAELEADPSLWIHVNPIQAWAEFESHAFIDEDDSTPATVVFFAVRNDVHTAILEAPGAAVVNELNARAPCRLQSLADCCPSLEREELVGICRALAEIGVVAFG